MLEFKILKKSKKSRARFGVLKTAHGEIQTPSFVPVATQAVVKTLTSDETEKTGSQILICNTFHLHLRPGEKVVKEHGGLHKFMQWQKPLMTDSGGFQVFSLGFGRDLKVGKILKYFPGEIENLVKYGHQSQSVKISDEGAMFNSPLDGRKIFIGPKESIQIQQDLRADIIFSFDECTPPLSTINYVKKSLKRTHVWAKEGLIYKKSNQAIFGIVQGSRFRSLREESAKFINKLDFQGFGIGGDLGTDKKIMTQILRWTIPGLDQNKPRHLLGIGHLEDIENIIKEGIDTFDCTVPTHYARRGIAFINTGKVNLRKTEFLKSKLPLDKKCKCHVCQTYSRGYIAHLIRASEITGLELLTFHNLHFFNAYTYFLREKIKTGLL